MIRKDQHAVADIRLIKRVIDRSDDLLINVLDRPDLVLHASLMSQLVRSFDVDIDKIKSVLWEGFHSSICPVSYTHLIRRPSAFSLRCI